jgi:hypothetical protein
MSEGAVATTVGGLIGVGLTVLMLLVVAVLCVRRRRNEGIGVRPLSTYKEPHANGQGLHSSVLPIDPHIPQSSQNHTGCTCSLVCSRCEDAEVPPVFSCVYICSAGVSECCARPLHSRSDCGVGCG